MPIAQLARRQRTPTAKRIMASEDLRSILSSLEEVSRACATMPTLNDATVRCLEIVATVVEHVQRSSLLDAALTHMSHGLVMTDADQNVVVCNDKVLDIYGVPRSLLRSGPTVEDLAGHGIAVGRDGPHGAHEAVAPHLGGSAERVPGVLEQRLPDGRIIEVHVRPIADGSCVMTYEDVTERRHVEADLEAQNRRFEAALSHMAQGLLMLDAELRLIVCNSRYRDLFDLPHHVARPGAHLADLIAYTGTRSRQARHNVDEIMAERRALLARGEPASTQFTIRDGRIIEVAYNPMQDGGWVATYSDITARQQAEARLAHMAQHDALTDLPNRTLFHERVRQALAETGESPRDIPDETTAVLCLDLDRFKAVNDTLGHATGDALLREVAQRLCASVGSGSVMVARLGGDEFALLLPRMRPEQVGGIARHLIDDVARGYEINGQLINVGLSIGIALAPADGDDPGQLLRAADMALYQAKGEGRGTFRFFESEMNARMQARRELELDLRQALASQQFELYYQPLVALDTDRIAAFEALVRWHHPTRGLVPPAEFIPLTEDIGLIVPLGKWVLEEACREAATWPNDVRVAVNLSPVQFRSPALVLTVVAALSAAGLDPRRLELEITEGVLLQDSEATLGILRQLKDLGVRIAVDDFGTGYSCLSYLRAFPFDKIKIDRSFIADIASRADAVAIVRAVTSLGANLGITTTAEGIETPEQLERLRQEGCTEVQGYLISRPTPARNLSAMLAHDVNDLRAGGTNRAA